jgi:accessory gene regulator protein AgrB
VFFIAFLVLAFVIIIAYSIVVGWLLYLFAPHTKGLLV